jgi:hypothetical protein
MTISYVSASNPYWYFPTLTGLPAGAGSIEFYSSLDPTDYKPVYQDPAGLLPYPDPLLINLNGTVPQLFFAVNSADPDDNYNISVFDAQGNLIEQLLDFTPPSGGGGGDITVTTNLQNIVTNNVFYRNIVQSPMPMLANTLIAPGAHQGLALTSSLYGPDIFFVKNNTNATDQITFTPFVPGDNFPTDVTPYEYLNYTCTNTPTGETVKCVQIPLTNKVQNLNNQNIAFSFWARGNSGPGNTLTASIVQFFGDGGGSSTISTLLNTFTLTDDWAFYSTTGAIPTIAAKTIGVCGNDGVFLQIGYPLDAACNIDMTKPALYFGDIVPTLNYQSYDAISGIIEAPRTGQFLISQNSFVYGGWVPMNDGVIGAVGSNPPSPIITTRAALDTFPLFNFIWNTFQSNQSLAPMYSTTSNVPIAYGSSSMADFVALNSISLTKQLGRLIANVGTPSSGNNTGISWAVGQTTGAELTNQVAAHEHGPDTSAGAIAFQYVGGTGSAGGGGAASTNKTGTTGVANVNIQNPVSYQNFFMKL